MQTTLSLLALLLVVLLSVQSLQIVTKTERKIVLNEISTQLSGVAVDVIERVGTTGFDEKADGATLTAVDSLTASANFGNAGCDFKLSDPTPCQFIEQFDSLNVQIDRNGTIYDIFIDVEYFDPLTGTTTTSKQWTKQVEVTISNPNLYISTPDNLLEVKMGRIFSYSPF